MQFSVDAVEDGRKCLEQLQIADYDIVLMDVSGESAQLSEVQS